MRDKVLAFASLLLAISVDAYEVNIPVEHSFDGETFKAAGQLQGGLYELVRLLSTISADALDPHPSPTENTVLAWSRVRAEARN